MAASAKPPKSETSETKGPTGSQTLLRGLDLIDEVAYGPIALTELAERLGLTRSTTHRLASALIDRCFLTFTPRQGYRLGPKLLELGFLAQQQADVVQIGRDHIEALAAASEDTVHLGVRDGDKALYLDKIPGRRRVDISSRVGDRQPMTSTGLGKALMLDDDARVWSQRFEEERGGDPNAPDYALWVERMRGYVGLGCAYDLEENEDQIRCVAAPIRDASGRIVAAISVSSAAQYMSDDRMTALTGDVLGTAHAISRDLGWRESERR
ncbi:IclR family transcriptional regulator [Sphingomonas fuzhouensis]|uniref:IclR family transcriptional regulator n=1 Tax=Sphingomonas fuzhouensis TaxID=3106033 RepID=UPI002AFFD537|nr:IclR family transcriptional regulator [Sphingomonas sp. SGZ-02]